jgi:hypothetical protein
MHGDHRYEVRIEPMGARVVLEADESLVRALRKASLELEERCGGRGICGRCINHMFLAAAIFAGVTCPTVDPSKVRQAVLAIDLILGRDRFAQKFLKDFRQRQDEG